MRPRGRRYAGIGFPLSATGLQNLRISLRARNLPKDYRVSHENFARNNAIETLPFYAVHRLIS